VEVKPGDCVKIDELEVANVYIHISQVRFFSCLLFSRVFWNKSSKCFPSKVALGEASKNEKSKEPVVVYLKVGVQKLVLGTLNREEIPQIPLDLVLDQEAKLSHTCQSAKSDEVEAALNLKDNGKVETKSEKVKIDEPKKDVSGAPAKKVNVVVPKKDEEDEDSDDDDDDESDDEDESGSEMDADSDEDGSDEDEKTPVKKVDQGKKRPNVSATKTPVPAAKKAKNVTPEKF
ncbi:hypothetical protein S245_043227, partial [Arachis hypogaea]